MNRNILITGGASGLGAAVVTAVTKESDTPLVLDQVVPAAGVEHQLVDLADSRATAQAVAELSARCGGIDAVVTAAGVDRCGRLADVPTDEWEKVIQVNLLGTAAVIRAAMPDLIERQGRVITVASTLGLRALPDASAYCASKFGVVGLTRALALEMAGLVDVSVLVPGGMRTPFFDGRDPQYQPGPDAMLNDPADVAEAVMTMLRQPSGCVIRELVITPSMEPSWP